MGPFIVVIAILVGLCIGILSGMLGIGGGTLMIPIFRLGFGMTAIAATATSLFAIVPTSLVGCATHIKNRTCIPKLGVITGLAGACASPIGVALASMSPSWMIMLAAGLVILYAAYNMIRKGLALPKTSSVAAIVGSTVGASQTVAAANPSPDGYTDLTADDLGKRIWLGIPIGLVAGLAAGYVGVGGGFIMVPMFLGVIGVMMKQASGTSLIAVAILAIPGVIEQALLGNITFSIGIAIFCGSIPGAIIGANLVRRIPERTLRLAFGVLLVITGIILIVNEFVF